MACVPGELGRTVVSCNPNCNPSRCSEVLWRRVSFRLRIMRRLPHQQVVHFLDGGRKPGLGYDLPPKGQELGHEVVVGRVAVGRLTEVVPSTPRISSVDKAADPSHRPAVIEGHHAAVEVKVLGDE